MAFAWCARQQFSTGTSPWGRELAAVLSFIAIVFLPTALYYCLVYPDWAWLYLVDPHRLPWGTSLLVLLGDVATLLGGYLAGWAILRARKPKLLNGLLGGLALTLIIMIIGFRGRLGNDGTYREYHAGHALSIAESKLIWALTVTTIGILVAAVLVGLTLWEQGKRFRPDD